MNPRANGSTQVTFTERGEVALDELAAALTADIPQDPAAIAAVLDRVMSADIEDLAAAVTRVRSAQGHRHARRDRW